MGLNEIMLKLVDDPPFVQALMERTFAVARLAANAFIVMLAETAVGAPTSPHGVARLRAIAPALRSGA